MEILSHAIHSTLPLRNDARYQCLQLPPVPLVNGIPKLLYNEEHVAEMFDFSTSTVRNRYDPESRWYDENFPEPRSTDGSGEGRKAAVRWYWGDLVFYAANLPRVSELKPTGKQRRQPKLASHSTRRNTGTHNNQVAGVSDLSDKPFEL